MTNLKDFNSFYVFNPDFLSFYIWLKFTEDLDRSTKQIQQILYHMTRSEQNKIILRVLGQKTLYIWPVENKMKEHF